MDGGRDVESDCCLMRPVENLMDHDEEFMAIYVVGGVRLVVELHNGLLATF